MNRGKRTLATLLVFSILVMGYMRYTNKNINDLGLSILSLAKKIGGNGVDLEALNIAKSSTIIHDNWTDLLQKHVTDKGEVDYTGFIKDSTYLIGYLANISSHPPGKNWSDNQKLAYWINAYNAFTIKLILDHYPLASIKDIGDGLTMINSPWDIKFFKINNVSFDLNTIEHEIIRKQFDEPRIHFAVNCASISCPKLLNEAYIPDRLDDQLEQQAIDFINNKNKNLISEKETKISKIFDWFRSDFSKDTNLSTFIQKYHSTLEKSNSIEFLDYNWDLNELNRQ